VRKAALSEADPDLDLTRIFQDSRNHGLQPQSLNQIAAEWAAKVKLSPSEVKAYLTENIYYYLDNACLQGLQLFYRYAQDSGALPPAPPLQFYEAHAVAK
jgi:chorismate dehydratase